MDLVDDRAILDDEEEDESFDEDTGEPKRSRNGVNGHFDDSSEEEDDDDDEEAAKEIAEGFIVDEDEDDEEARRERRRERKKKRRREEREREDEGLDEEDLELIGLKSTEEAPEPKFKRLKRGPREEREEKRSYGVNDIFRDSDEEDDPADARKQARLYGKGPQNEFDDFIEDDPLTDEEQQQQEEDAEVARPRRRGLADLGIADAAGLDETAMEDFREAFGDGTDYDFALEREEEADYEQAEKDRHLNLKDVFEPSQLAERLLTDEDNQIRHTDEPERHQIARKPYRNIELTEEETKEEAVWISKFMIPKKRLDPEYNEPFRRAVSQVLDFLVRDNYEVPFIFQHRKDYLIHAHHGKVEKLINQNDLWDIFERDLKFRALIERRHTLQKQYDDLRSMFTSADKEFQDLVFEDMLPAAQTMEELQDVQDYLHFQYASEMKDLALTGDGETNGTSMSRKKAATKSIFEEIRSGRAYGLVRAFGINADAVAKNALDEGLKTYADDPTESPDNLADTFIDEEFPTGERVLKAAKAMFVEEFVQSPRFRKYMRKQLYQTCVIDCNRTDKGLRRIDEHHPYYEFKYLRNQDLPSIAARADLYLKMLKAEEEGLIEVNVRMPNKANLKKQLNKTIVTDNYSTIADAWNAERRDVLSTVVDRLESIMGKYVKEQVKTECEEMILRECREEFNRRLDQAPYQPRGMKKGTTPRVLTMSIGAGIPGRDPICWAYVSDDGRILENGRFTDLAPGDKDRGIPDGKDVAGFIELIQRREPEVIGISGWSPDTRKVSLNLETIVKNHDLRGPTYADDDDRDRSDPLEVVVINDEIARLYRSSDRAKEEHSSLAPLTLYCVSLARYMQDPLKEYAALGRDIVSIGFHPAQHLISQDKLIKTLETALIDNVNMVGVDLEDAANDSSTANLLTYVCGLGPRKAAHLLKAVNMNQNYVKTRASLLGLNEGHAQPVALGFGVWRNAASFLYIRYDQTEDDAEFLDSTRIHPEDYDIARKMAADALELDEEDIEAETREFGNGAIVRRLIKEEAQDRVNDLVLEEYAEQLEKNLNARKRATLENITAEINDPYEELRNPFITRMSESELFTMLTGETRESLQKGMTVPMQIKRVTDLSVEGRLDSGLEAHTMDGEATDPGISPKQIYAPHQTVQAHVLNIDRKNFTAGVSLRDELVKRPFRRSEKENRGYDEWDDRQEAADKKLLEQKTEAGGRITRVIKHPLFKAFNSKQAEEYLGSQNRGDVVIRPSSKGTDHLAVTWKVADGVFQHIDVLELDKENEFSLGKTLRVGGRYSYSDLDELIVMHVKAMARKVDEMMNNEKFQDKTKAGLDEWLTTYTNANPKRSMYQFCTNREKPGNFHLCFKAGQKAKLMDWNVRVIPQGFELMKQPYPTMRDLCNGFKLIFSNMQNAAAAMGHGGRR